MFQNFDDITRPEDGPPRLAALREAMAEHTLDMLLLPRSDEYQSEYLAPYAERVAWLTGFTGSNAFVVVTGKEAGVFTDGRYTLQIRSQTDAGAYTALDMMETPPLAWALERIEKGWRVGVDTSLMSLAQKRRWEAALTKAGASLVATRGSLVDALWTDRPERPRAPLSLFPEAYAGRSLAEKLALIRKKMKDADHLLLTQADSIAYALNIRGADLPHMPVALSMALIARDGPARLFIDPGKIDAAVRSAFSGAVEIDPEDALLPALEALGAEGACVMIDPTSCNAALADRLAASGARLVEAEDPVVMLRAVKTPQEQAATRAAHLRDGAAMVRFLAFLDREAPKGRLDEIAAAKALEGFRHDTGALKEISFDTISGAGPNGAIVHYRVTQSTNRPIRKGDVYLVDSGAQYEDGTTDITRTVAIGPVDPEAVRCATLVLKGHIALASARFPKGTPGAQIDTLARHALWQHGLDFAHGTGHGVGIALGVHEGPVRISKAGMKPLEPGMLLSNEPGYYREGAFGIRIENLVLVSKAEAIDGGEEPMLGFETITLAPIDQRLIDPALLTKEEIAWLDAYHARVAEEIGPLVDGEDRDWLGQATRPLT
ncbi:MAG: aminopeptidase P family protein [Hyphomicrobiaceae bacterium]|nr:aminopeptidase P family protein [Hyphomicrobiaceae bacterium]